MNPRSTRERIEAGELDPQMVLDWMVNGTAAALHCHQHVVIEHLFSALPTLGLVEGRRVAGSGRFACDCGGSIRRSNRGGRAPTVSDGTYSAAISAPRCPTAAEHR